ncbi:DUF5709 domain-containing protein [Ornithinimicrobium sp. Y1694]|uniref:DUF5709 domain-containing protein n=1 Tax=Ornithinimicrobium sp. Y1694 TaxID=3418590 RepID=UPI003CEF993B
MSEDRDMISDGLGVYSVDEEDQLDPSDTLDEDSRDPLDRGYRVGDQYRWSSAYSDGAETIDQRLRQEVQDPYAAYDDAAAAQEHPGRIIAPDEGRYPDREARLVAREGQATSWDSPEESAMHYVDESELTDS